MRKIRLSAQYNSPFEKLLIVFTSADQLHKTLGGSGLKIEGVHPYQMIKTPDSPYELFAGTQWETKRGERIEHPLGPRLQELNGKLKGGKELNTP